MPNPFIKKLEHGCDLTDDDRTWIQQAVAHPVAVAEGQTLIYEGDTPKNVHVILQGFACRYNQLDNGKRQITAYLVPGDLCDLHVNILREMDHSIGTFTPCKVARIPPETIQWLMSVSPRINRALWWATLVDVSTCRAWLTSMGQQTAERQIGHLLCELLARLQAVGWADDNGYDLPLTQQEFGDTLGLSTVHINRSLQTLRKEGLVTWKGGRVTVTDIDKLREFAGFKSNYLHLKTYVTRP